MPLCYAAKVGSLETIKVLLESGANVEDVDVEGGIGGGGAAMMALYHGEQRAAEMLINVGLPVSLDTVTIQVSKFRKPRFDMKKFFENVHETIDLSTLLEHKCEGLTFLHQCIKWAKYDGVQFLLDHGADAGEPLTVVHGNSGIVKFSDSDRQMFSNFDLAVFLNRLNEIIENKPHDSTLLDGTYSCIKLAQELRDHPQDPNILRLGFLQFKDYQKRIDNIVVMLEQALHVDLPSEKSKKDLRKPPSFLRRIRTSLTKPRAR